jgi:7-cyano-7-deazaguanine reductase
MIYIRKLTLKPANFVTDDDTIALARFCGFNLLAITMSRPNTKAVPPATHRLATPVAQRNKPSKQLDVFDNPTPDRDYTIRFDIPEFTCLCPLTGQPDFAHFIIEIVPNKLCVELKSLKMYTWSFRDEGAFHERVTNTILDDIVKAIKPRFARIDAAWNVRGGIGTDVVAEYRKPGWKPQPLVTLPSSRE